VIRLVHRLRRTVLVLVVLAATFGVLPGPALAECSTYDRWPSFGSVAPDAYAVVTGKVERIVSRDRGHVSSFVLRVKHVIKGEVTDRIRLEDVYTTGGCVVSWLDVKKGDRIAIALGGDSNVSGPVAAVAYLGRIPADTDMAEAGMERLTLREVRDAARSIPLDHSPVAAAMQAITDSVRAIVLLLELVGWQLGQEEDFPPLPFP
jgi:hypothetical protein